MERPNAYARVLGRLRGAILAGVHPPGSRLHQVELARRYGTSRIPLREALRTLEAEGLVTSESNRGATVATLDAVDLAELYVFRFTLERVAARLAAGRRVDLRPRVEGWRREAAAALRNGRIDALIEADVAFHNAIAEAAGNRHVYAALEGRLAHISRAMQLYLSASTYRDGVWEEHAEIAEAIAAGDEDLAETLLGAHVRQSEYVVLSRLAAAP